MRLTTRGRYAVTALLDLAIQEDRHQGAVSLSDIAKRQSISVSYLEQLFSKLRKAGLVVSVRGAAGGYHLARPLSEINIMSIITAVDEGVNAMQCDGEGNCQDGKMCLTHELWYGLSEHIADYLKNVTLAQLLPLKNTQAIADRQAAMMSGSIKSYDLQPCDLKSQDRPSRPMSHKKRSSKTKTIQLTEVQSA